MLRWWLWASLAAVVVGVLAGEASYRVSARHLSGGVPFPAVTGATYGTPWKYWQTPMYPPKTVNGDGWNTTWDRLGRIVTLCDDCSSWNATGAGNNIKLNLLTNFAADGTTVGSDLNVMPSWQGGRTPSGGTFKWNGITSVQGVLYALITILSTDGIHTLNAQLVKSTDDGASFTPVPPAGAQYASPMWPSTSFPYSFVQYGQNYTGSGPDNSGIYVYAIMGTPIVISTARVLKTAIANLNAADWSYYKGGDGNLDASWSSVISDAVEINNPLYSSTGAFFNNMQYLPRYGKYFAQAVLWPGGGDSSSWYGEICDHPWGPCVQVGSTFNTNPNGFYLPSIAPASLINGGQQFTITTAGNYVDAGNPTGRYTLTMIPVTLTP